MDATLQSKTAATARNNALSILVVAGLATLWLAAQGHALAVFGAVLCSAAVLELRGAKLLLADPLAARPMLVGAELAVLVLMLGYCAWRLASFDFDAELAALPETSRQLLLDATGDDEAVLREMMVLANRITYGVLAVVTLFYQGGMALFYRRRIARIVGGAPA